MVIQRVGEPFHNPPRSRPRPSESFAPISPRTGVSELCRPLTGAALSLAQDSHDCTIPSMPAFWLTYSHNGSPSGVVILNAPDLTTARARAAADGIDDGATFVEGRDLGDLALAMAPDVFDRMLSPDEAAALLDSVGGFPPAKGERS
jgi:hypothetical protein